METVNKKKAGRPKGRKNKFRTSQEKMELILAYYKSEKGYAKFAKENEISPSVFYSWIKKYENEGLKGLVNKRAVNGSHETLDDKLSEIMILNNKIEKLEKQVEKLEQLI